jgi:hypothetical protein
MYRQFLRSTIQQSAHIEFIGFVCVPAWFLDAFPKLRKATISIVLLSVQLSLRLSVAMELGSH